MRALKVISILRLVQITHEKGIRIKKKTNTLLLSSKLRES